MNPKFKILVVEDEEAIRTGLLDVLVFHSYEVDFAEDGKTGLKKALSGQFDLILLDVMLPEMDGFTVCDNIRQQDKSLPIIMLTAKSQDEDIIQGLKLGADDYVAKPFSIEQLILRIQAVLRRCSDTHAEENNFLLGETLSIDINNLRGQRGDETLSFTRKEMDILVYLKQHHERPVSRDELLHKVWGYDKNLAIETRTVDIHMAKLRRKLEADHKEPTILVTVRGAGYKLICN